MDVPHDNPNDPEQIIQNAERRALVRQQLILLLHAYKCIRSYEEEECMLAHCATMRRILIHLETCQEVTTCPEPHCCSSRQIINHWKNCESVNCQLCSPLKQTIKKEWQQSVTEEQRRHLVDLLLQTLSVYVASRADTEVFNKADTLENYYRMMAAKKWELEMVVQARQRRRAALDGRL